MNCEVYIFMVILAIVAFLVYTCTLDHKDSIKPSDSTDNLAKEQRLAIESLQRYILRLTGKLGDLQKEGKRRMVERDIKNGMTAWREIDGILYRETIQNNVSPYKDMYPYEWCYAVGGPWGCLWVSLSEQKWWVEDKKKR